MSCPECDEERKRATEQALLRAQAKSQGVVVHVTRAQNAPVPPSRPAGALPAGPGIFRRG